MSEDLCRLCSSTEGLIDIYELQAEDTVKLTRSIAFATGINIKDNDPISRKICSYCSGAILKFDRYRMNTTINDMKLKKECGQPYVPPITDPEKLTRIFEKMVEMDFDRISLNQVHSTKNYIREETKVVVTKTTYQDSVTSSIFYDTANSDRNQSTNIIRPTVYRVNDIPFEHRRKYVKNQVITTETGIIGKNLLNDNKKLEVKNQSHANVPIAQPKTNNQSSANKLNILSHYSIFKSAVTEFKTKENCNIEVTKSSCDSIPKHSFVQKLLSKSDHIIIPKDVHSVDVQPKVLLDKNAITNWYNTKKNYLRQYEKKTAPQKPFNKENNVNQNIESLRNTHTKYSLRKRNAAKNYKEYSENGERFNEDSDADFSSGSDDDYVAESEIDSDEELSDNENDDDHDIINLAKKRRFNDNLEDSNSSKSNSRNLVHTPEWYFKKNDQMGSNHNYFGESKDQSQETLVNSKHGIINQVRTNSVTNKRHFNDLENSVITSNNSLNLIYARQTNLVNYNNY